MELRLKKVKNGEKFYGECVALDDELRVITDGNIQIWAYSYPEFVLGWWIFAEQPGSKGFRNMLKTLQKVKPLKVVQPMQNSLYDLFYDLGIEMVSVTPEIPPRIPKKPDISTIGALRNNHYLPDDFAPFTRAYMQQMMFGKDVDPGHEPDGRFEMRYSPEMENLVKRLYAKYPHIFESDMMVNSRFNPIFPTYK